METYQHRLNFPKIRPEKGAGRSPVSRILYPGTCFPGGDHFSKPLVTREFPLARDATNTRGYGGRAALPLFCLAPREVCRAAPVARSRGGLLPHPFTLTCALAGHRRYALCCTVCPGALTLPSLLFRRRVALRCPDFPRPCKQGRDHPESGGAKIAAKTARGKGQVPGSPHSPDPEAIDEEPDDHHDPDE